MNFNVREAKGLMEVKVYSNGLKPINFLEWRSVVASETWANVNSLVRLQRKKLEVP